jgi:Tfp pilus assembly protein PilO
MNKIIIISAILAVVLIFGFVLLLPKYQDLQIINSNIEEKTSELQSKEGYFNSVKNASSTLAQYQEPLSKIASALPQDPSLSPVLNFFQSIASQTGLLLEKINLGGMTEPKEKTNAPVEIRAAIQLKGSYKSLKDFILAVETSARLIEIEKLSFEVSEDKETLPTAKMDIKVYSY